MKKYIIIIFFNFLFFQSCGLLVESNKEWEAEVYNEKGNNLLKYFLFDEALIEFKKAADIATDTNPYKGDYLRNVGLSFSELSELDSAIYYYSKALNYYSKNSFDYHCLLGELYTHKGDIRLGLIELKKANRIDPDNFITNNLIGLVYLGTYDEEHLNYEKALTYNLKAFEKEKSTTLKYVLAINYYELEEYSKSRELFEELIRFNRLDADTRFHLGMIEYKTKNYDKAKEHFEELKLLENELDPNLNEIYEEIGMFN